jgi:cell division protein FtsB
MAAAAPARAAAKRAERPAAPAPPRAPRPRRPPARPRLAGSVLRIALVAALLAGIVAVNVAALQLRLDAQRLEERKEQLVGENAAAASELSKLASAERIEVEASRLGLVRPSETTYVRVRPGRR